MGSEFLMLCQNYDEEKYSISNWMMSEKIDGMRCLWDGGITRGLYCDQVPFANTEKDYRLVVRPKSTGLWSRYGKPIQAPDWWLAKLPPYPLDGELWMGRQNFQQLVSCVKKHEPGPEWKSVIYSVFDSPKYQEIFFDRKINNTNFKKSFSGILTWLKGIAFREADCRNEFEIRYGWLRKNLQQNEVVALHSQFQLPAQTSLARDLVQEKLQEISSQGGEGIILRSPVSYWKPERSHQILKVKKLFDAEATVVGYTWGRETDKGSKLLGLMGALICDFNGKVFELSGFTEAERQMIHVHLGPEEAFRIGCQNPGLRVSDPLTIYNTKFPIRSKVTFTYRELTDSGVPKEARFLRKY